MLTKQNKKRKGFTLVELIVVIAVLAVLAVLGTVAYTNISQSARDAANRADAATVARSINLYNSLLTDSTTAIDTLAEVTFSATGNLPLIVTAGTNGIITFDASVSVDPTRVAEILTWLVAPSGTNSIWGVAAAAVSPTVSPSV